MVITRFLQRPLSANKLNLILFPFAGGSGEYYHRWLSHFHSEIQPQYICLPGRGRFMDQVAYDKIDDLCQDLLPIFQVSSELRLAFFGHSMGALIAFELAKLMQQKGLNTLDFLFVSGHRAPSIPLQHLPFHTCAEDDLIKSLRAMGGIPDEITVDDLRPFLPTIYNDLKLCETYKYNPSSELLDVPVTVLYAEDDEWIASNSMDDWQKVVSCTIAKHVFQGGHFYLNQQYESIIALINQTFFGHQL